MFQSRPIPYDSVGCDLQVELPCSCIRHGKGQKNHLLAHFLRFNNILLCDDEEGTTGLDRTHFITDEDSGNDEP